MRLGQTSMQVEFDFRFDEHEYRVIRKRTRGRTGQSDLQFQVRNGDGSFRPLTEQGVRATQERINQTLQRADQIHHAEGKDDTYWFAPIIADAEAGFGGPLNAFELMKGMIEAGAAGVHFEDQLSSEKKCGHLGGKVLIPTSHFIRTLQAARLAADVSDVPTLVVARTDANGAFLLTSDIDPRDREFCTGERTPEGFFVIRGGLDTTGRLASAAAGAGVGLLVVALKVALH